MLEPAERFDGVDYEHRFAEHEHDKISQFWGSPQRVGNGVMVMQPIKLIEQFGGRLRDRLQIALTSILSRRARKFGARR